MYWESIANRMSYIWTFYGEKDRLPKDAKICDIAMLYEPWKQNGETYLYTWTSWVPITSFWTDLNIPTQVVWNWDTYKRYPTPEEVDRYAATMIKDICLKHKNDNEALHCDCDDVLRVVLESLWLSETLKAYEEASHNFRYA